MFRAVAIKESEGSEILFPLDKYVRTSEEARFKAFLEGFNPLKAENQPAFIFELQEFCLIVHCDREDRGIPWEGIKFIYGIKDPDEKELTEPEKREIMGGKRK